MNKEVFVLGMRYPLDIDLPDILEENDGSVMYFSSEMDARKFLQSLYDEKNLKMLALIDDNVELMRVQ
jgi:hypothetical protein